MTRHAPVELPAHLPIRFFDCQLSATLIEVLDFDAVIFLLATWGSSSTTTIFGWLLIE